MKQKQVTIKAVCRGRYASLPRRMHPGDAGFDLVANSRQMDIENNCYVYGTGLSVEVPRGYVMLIFPRSSCYKHAALMANCVAVIK
jgi:dUTP pyrophosphatase